MHCEETDLTLQPQCGRYGRREGQSVFGRSQLPVTLMEKIAAWRRCLQVEIGCFLCRNHLTREEDKTSRPGAWGTPGPGMMSLVTNHRSSAASGKGWTELPRRLHDTSEICRGVGRSSRAGVRKN